MKEDRWTQPAGVGVLSSMVRNKPFDYAVLCPLRLLYMLKLTIYAEKINALNYAYFSFL